MELYNETIYVTTMTSTSFLLFNSYDFLNSDIYSTLIRYNILEKIEIKATIIVYINYVNNVRS